MHVVNESRVEAEYQLNPEVIRESYQSNRVSTYLYEQRMKAVLSVDCNQARLYDIVTFHIALVNQSEVTIPKAYICAIFQQGLQFVKNSVCMDGVHQWGTNIAKGFYLPCFPAGRSMIISYEAVICGNCREGEAYNQINVVYDHIYNIMKPPIPIPIVSNTKILALTYFLYSEQTQSYTLNLCPGTSICCNQCIATDAQTKCVRMIETQESSYIFAMGVIRYNLCVSNGKRLQRHCWHFGVSSLIPVSEGVQYCDCYKVDFDVSAIQFEQQRCQSVEMLTQISARVTRR